LTIKNSFFVSWLCILSLILKYFLKIDLINNFI
jgi:hypothetical protein